MKLKSINIKNYRSIEDVTIPINALADDSLAFGLIGVNEAGKSSILKAIAIKDGLINLTPKDFTDKDKHVEISLYYELSKAEKNQLKEHLANDVTNSDKAIFDESKNITINYYYSLEDLTGQTCLDDLKDQEGEPTHLNMDLAYFNDIHTSIFWTNEERYLISAPINLDAFSKGPPEVSVPLENCFLLADIKDIPKRIATIQGDPAETDLLETELAESVTAHISSVWINHPIEIKFKITDGHINFLVKDLDVKKAKTADQRSDGFKQFISFLLTVSAQNKNQELSNTILLLDEPETHLHPKAQEFLLKEITQITKNKRNNLALFATHSNYMIDKEDLSRNFRIEKKDNKTIIDQLCKSKSTYASVNYHVFDVVSTDYYNELYSKLHERYINEAVDENDAKARSFQLNFDDNYLKGKQKQNKIHKDTPNRITLLTYIRNCIHHPLNGNPHKEQELKECINKVIELLE